MAKKKRVLFFSGGEIDKDGQMHQWTVAKWSQLFTAIQRNAPEDNNVTHRGRKYIATPHTSKSGEPYFRVTVARYKADWPDVETKDHAAPLSVKEYACVLFQVIRILRYSNLLLVRLWGLWKLLSIVSWKQLLQKASSSCSLFCEGTQKNALRSL